MTVTLAVEVMIAGVFASGINLLTGYTGLVSLGQAMFLGLGGYGIAIGTALLGWPLWVSAPVTLVVVAAIAAAIGAICTRTRGVAEPRRPLSFGQIEPIRRQWLVDRTTAGMVQRLAPRVIIIGDLLEALAGGILALRFDRDRRAVEIVEQRVHSLLE